MAGNVYQWTKDWYAPLVRNYRNPTGPDAGSEKVVKGGSFVEGPLSLRSPHRDRYPPDFSSNLFGMRCVCDSIPLQTARTP
jgi:formylglycine-generating enzyme required for sulfatase activity